MIHNCRSYLPAILRAACCLALVCPVRAQIRDGGIDPWNLGKGDWIYSISDATNKLGNHVAAVTNEPSLMLFYKSQGIRHVIVKAGTGATLFNGCYGFPQFTANLVNIAHANDILIFGYNRSYATNVAGEVAIADFVFSQGADGFVWDAESEWESATIGSQGPSLAWQQCSTVRSNWPNKFLAHAPFPIIYLHSSFPYKEFGYWCDAVMPQIYHFSATKGSQSAGINWTDINWKTWQNSLSGLAPSSINGVTVYWTNSIKPIVPVNDVYGPRGTSPCEGTTSPYPDKDVLEFMDYLEGDPNAQTAGGYKGVNFWRADLHGPTQWSYIKSSTSGNFTGIVNNVVIDNVKATTAGTWAQVQTFSQTTTAVTFVGDGSGTDTNSFGTNYLTRTRGNGSGYVQFTPNIVVPGDYDLFQWHPGITNSSSAVPFIINYNGGSSTVLADQQTNGGNWSLLGRFNFLAGTSANIRVTDGFPEPGAVAIADGIKLMFVAPTSVPAAPSGLGASPISSSQINLSWNHNATNDTGYVVARSTVSGGPYPDLARLPGGVTNYNDSGLSPSTTYYYVVRATNFLGASANSPQASSRTLSSPTPPSITAQPQNQTNIAGQNATFYVTAVGSGPLGYQWLFNGVDIPSEIGSSYTRSNVQPPDSGAYSVIVTNAYGSVTSAPATLTVEFSLIVITNGSGSVTKNPSLPSYAPNSPVDLDASPNADFAFIGWSVDADGTNNPLTLVVTNNLSIAANFVSTATDFVIDNPDPAASFFGGWQTGSAAVGRYGIDYRFASTIAGGLSNAVYRPYIYTPGYYDVYVWYAQGSNRATNAPWSVVYSGGATNISVDQTINGGNWFLISTGLLFQKGTNAYASLSNDTGYSGKVVIADAVRFALSTPFPSPPQIDFISFALDGIHLQVSGGPGHFGIDASSNLVDWLELTNFISNLASFEFIESAANFPQRFYRARIVP